MKPKLSGKLITLLTVGSLITSLSHATLLTPGNGVSPSFEAEPVGATLVTSLTTSFTGLNNVNAVVFTGSLKSSVWSGDTSNPFGGLTFTYALTNDLNSLDTIGELNLASFAGFLTDVSVNGPGVIPLAITRSGAVPNPFGSKISFLLLTGPPGFQENLLPGQYTSLLIVQTDALDYTTGNAAIINAGTANTATLVPATVVPEPTTLALAALGLLAAVGMRKSRA
jgi:hypothetical protein